MGSASCAFMQSLNNGTFDYCRLKQSTCDGKCPKNETNFQHHFGTPEMVAKYIKCPHGPEYICNQSRKHCKKCIIAWLNSPIDKHTNEFEFLERKIEED